MPDHQEDLYAELRELTQELETMRTEFMADNSLDNQERSQLQAMQTLINKTQQEIAQLQAPASDATTPELMDAIAEKVQQLKTLEEKIQQFLAKNPFSFNYNL